MAFETNAAQNVAQYFNQYLAAATKGNVSFIVSPASIADPTRPPQLHLLCRECKTAMSCDAPTSTVIDYGIQEFVKLHAHNGEYKKSADDLIAQREKLEDECRALQEDVERLQKQRGRIHSNLSPNTEGRKFR